MKTRYRTASARRSTFGLAAMMGLVFGVPLALGQDRVTTIDELRGKLRAGEDVSIAGDDGMVFEGKLIEVSETGLELELRDDPDASLSRGSTIVPYGAIRSLERPRDSTANGTRLGLLIGAGFAGALFVVAYSKDANEFADWGSGYALFALFTTGVGAATGWLVDRLRSAPLQYDRPGTAGPMRFRAAPILNGDTRGVSVAIRF